MPVAIGDKFAAIVFGNVRRVNVPAPVQVTNDLSLEAGMVIPLDDHWTNWIGRGAAEAFRDGSITLLAKRASNNPLVLDAESQQLKRLVQSFLYGCCLVSVPDYQPEAVLLVGGVGAAGAEVRELITLHTFYRQQPAPRTTIDANYATTGWTFGQGVDAVFAGADTHRVRRGFNAWLRGVWEKPSNRKLHQFVRSVDGVLHLPQGGSRREFIARSTHLVRSANAHVVLDELYRLRSTEEHLNDWNAYLGPIAGADAQSRYAARAWQAETLASAMYRVLFQAPALRASFVDDAATDAFWVQGGATIQAAWNLQVDLDAAATETGYVGP